jgi:hypothetical protein
MAHPMRHHHQRLSISLVDGATQYTNADCTTSEEALIHCDITIESQKFASVSLVGEGFDARKPVVTPQAKTPCDKEACALCQNLVGKDVTSMYQSLWYHHMRNNVDGRIAHYRVRRSENPRGMLIISWRRFCTPMWLQ